MRKNTSRTRATVALYSICVFAYGSYLDGATPTKLGPRPLKSERGPSFSSINLRKIEKVRTVYVTVLQPCHYGDR